MTTTRYSVAIGLAVFLASTVSFAQPAVPERISFNGRLRDAAGAPVTGTHALVFSLFDVATGGVALWSETYSAGAFTADGLTFVELGTNTPLTTTILDGRKLFLEISVDAVVMSPRVGVLSVPYAIRATEAARLGSLTGTSAWKNRQARINRTGPSPASTATWRVVNDDQVDGRIRSQRPTREEPRFSRCSSPLDHGSRTVPRERPRNVPLCRIGSDAGAANFKSNPAAFSGSAEVPV